MSFWPRPKPYGAHRRRRQRRVAVLVVLLALAAGAAYGAVYASSRGSTGGDEPSRYGRVLRADSKGSPEEPVPGAAAKTPEGAVYWAVASELPGTNPESIRAVYRSKLDPSWASVYVKPSGEVKPFVVFVKEVGDAWETRRSIRADEADHAKNEVVNLGGVPKDLVQYIYLKNAFAADVPAPKEEKVDTGALPSVEPPDIPPPRPVIEGVPASERERVEKELAEVRQKVEGYGGVAGVYVYDLKGRFGYGVRPDEQFFTASIIKIPIMVAVYRKVDEGKLSFSQMVEIKEEDWAPGRVGCSGRGPGRSRPWATSCC